jgi:hypothetical protein
MTAGGGAYGLDTNKNPGREAGVFALDPPQKLR